MTANRKLTAQFLDSAAARAEAIGRAPATPRQCWYLAGLLTERGQDDTALLGTNSNAVLTKAAASNFIDDLLRDKAA